MPVVLLIVLFVMAISTLETQGYTQFTVRTQPSTARSIKMEYIPDGLSKAQWEQMKKKELDANKGKNLGAVGMQKPSRLQAAVSFADQ